MVIFGPVSNPVAPHWGAWIEISTTPSRIRSGWSHPTGVRGLKYHVLADAEAGQVSHPTGVRGLKSTESASSRCVTWSHPTGVRGLKYQNCAARP